MKREIGSEPQCATAETTAQTGVETPGQQVIYPLDKPLKPNGGLVNMTFKLTLSAPACTRAPPAA